MLSISGIALLIIGANFIENMLNKDDCKKEREEAKQAWKETGEECKTTSKTIYKSIVGDIKYLIDKIL